MAAPAVSKNKIKIRKDYRVSSAEINRNLRNPLTSMKILLDLIYLHLPDSDFKYRALEIMNSQIGRMEGYLNYLEETSIAVEGDEGGEAKTRLTGS